MSFSNKDNALTGVYSSIIFPQEKITEEIMIDFIV